MAGVTKDHVLAWLKRCAEVFAEEQDFLTELDTPIGDADHGINLCRGFTAVAEAIDPPPEGGIGPVLKLAGMTLLRTVGGASGPLYGTMFMKAAAVAKDHESADPALLRAITEAGVLGLASRGKAHPGDKTMCDTWWPVLEAAKAGTSLPELVPIAKAAAEATTPMQAKKGRASYLAERSIGHQDPGATSSYILLRTLAEVVYGSELGAKQHDRNRDRLALPRAR